jgi:hypothetical protein
LIVRVIGVVNKHEFADLFLVEHDLAQRKGVPKTHTGDKLNKEKISFKKAFMVLTHK